LYAIQDLYVNLQLV